MPSFKKELKKVHVEEVIPSVIEPSFGVGRVFYSLLEHSFRSGLHHVYLCLYLLINQNFNTDFSVGSIHKFCDSRPVLIVLGFGRISLGHP